MCNLINTHTHTHGLCFTPDPMACGVFLRDGMFCNERGGGLTPVGPQVDTATFRTVLSTNRVDLESFSSRYCAFRLTHTSADPIRLLCIRLAMPLTPPLPSGFVPNVRLVVCVSPRPLWCVCVIFRVLVCLGSRGEEDLHRWAHKQVDTSTIRTVLSTNRVDLGRFLAHDAVRFGVDTRAQTLFGYYVSY